MREKGVTDGQAVNTTALLPPCHEANRSYQMPVPYRNAAAAYRMVERRILLLPMDPSKKTQAVWGAGGGRGRVVGEEVWGSHVVAQVHWGPSRDAR